MAGNLLLRIHQDEEGIKDARALLELDPHRIAYVDLLAELLLQAGQNSQALSLLQNEISISPTSLPLQLLLTRALSASGQAHRAVTMLNDLASQHGDDPNVWQAMIVACRSASDRLGLYRARAEIDDLYGHDKQALQQLQMGLQAAGSDYPEHARFESRIEELNKEESQK